ncbi:MAG: HypC/HybG/HupF family hydrogenase formation chaperone [Patescibacteria group bacterium]|jgi:hydrogenase expression/formation protein HypC
MCLAIPGKIKEIKGAIALFDYEGEEYKADISLVQNPKVGDWILMHDGRALSKISETEAKENLKFIKTHKEMDHHDTE